MNAAFQDCYPKEFSHCYGCGKLNPQGHHLKSFWEGDSTVARFTPDPKYSGGVPDHVYGGLIASLLDCHGTASAAAFTYRAENREIQPGDDTIRYVTASLKVDYRRPTPMGVELIIRGSLRSMEARKVWVELTLSANGEVCALGEMLAIRFMPRQA